MNKFKVKNQQHLLKSHKWYKPLTTKQQVEAKRILDEVKKQLARENPDKPSVRYGNSFINKNKPK